MKTEIYPLLQAGHLIAFDHPQGRLLLPVLEVMGRNFIRVDIPRESNDIWDFHDARIGPPF